MKLLDGKALSETIKEEIKEEVDAHIAMGKKRPHLAAILVGTDGASETYVASKVRSCQKVGFDSTLIKKHFSTSEEELIKEIHDLNNDGEVDGFIVQLPLPKHINEQKIIQHIAKEKDVDGFHPSNVGRMVQGLDTYLPATPYGILQLLERYEIETEGKECVILGRSNIVGTPMSILLSQKRYPGNCTVTICHSRTKDIASVTKKADILIAAIGIPEFVTGDMIKRNAVVIDVGISRVKDETKTRGYSLKGDVLFDDVAPLSSYITPVPGGVGPMTVTSLLLNTFKANKGLVYPKD